MGNCASEDATCKGQSAIRPKGMKKNPNEADVVIDTTPILKPKKEVNIVEESNASLVNPNSSDPQEIIPFPKNGIRLSYLLNDFVKECGGREALKGLTTTDVCNQFVKPLTKDYELSYCDMILEKAKSNTEVDGVVDTATVFISHAWKYKFLDVLSALEDHFKDEPDKIVWFDLVSNNQIKDPELSYKWWATTFKGAIEQFGHTVMVMAPWNDPIPYKRAWCIFEAYCTSVTDAKFEIAMSNNEHQAFIEECKREATDIINIMLSIVDAEKSEAWNPLDKDRIHSVIKDEIGFTKINSMVFEQLRDWVLVVALAELKRVKIDTEEEIDLIHLVGHLYYDQGNYEKAEPLYKKCLAKRKTILGADHPDTLTSMSNLAVFYVNQGRHGEAEPLFKECLAKTRKILGSNHAHTLTSMNNLAEFYESQGRYDEAEPLIKECLVKRETMLGSDHPATLTSMSNLAAFYYNQGRHDETESLYKECLAKQKNILGSNHPHTLISMNNLALVYKIQSKYDEAEPLYKECVAKREMIQGSNHPATLTAISNLAEMYESQGKYDEAETLHKECTAKQQTMLGSDHPDTLISINNLAGLYCDQGKFDEAEPLYKKCLAKQKMILGSDHPATLTAMNDLAVFNRDQGKYDEAESLFKECLAKREVLLGSDHLDTLFTIFGLAKSYVDQGKYEEAKPLYQLHLKNCVNKLGSAHPLSSAIRENLDNVQSLQ